ncbi:MAG TPA: glycosyltransferase family 39 protein [Saprospiraceae bacterium]|nr:glycosyltransferase family 39 protein [Saprospiraceae bacterium]
MSEKKIPLFVLFFFILVWVAFKWNSLYLPYFWDEAWSYVPAISEMAGRRPCLIPGCINTELYRGHPLLFYFLSAGWMKWIGGSLWSMHFFAMLISIAAVISFYRLLSLVLTSYQALFGAGLLILQEAFYVQSSFVLPEVFILLLTLESIRSYVNGQKYYFLIVAGLLGVTKETGVVVIISFALYHLFTERGFRLKSCWVYGAMLPAVIYFVLQKIMLGWFFYPLHLDLMDMSLPALCNKAELILKFIFFDQGRKLILIIPGIVLIALQFLRNRRKYLLAFIAVLVLSIFTYIHESIFSIFIFIFLIYYYARRLEGFTSLERLLFKLIGILFTSCFAFSVFNFLMVRYMLMALPLLILVFSIIMQKATLHPPFYFPALCIILLLNFSWSFYYNDNIKEWHDDASINYIHIVKVHQQVVAYCEEEKWFEREIYTHFLLQQDLTNLAAGYLSSPVTFIKVNYQGNVEPEDEIIIFSSIEFEEWKYKSVKDNSKYRLAKRFEINKAWAEIYTLNE